MAWRMAAGRGRRCGPEGKGRGIVVILPSNEEVEADLVGTDPLADISVLKIKPDGKREFTPVEFGDSSLLRVGDSVLAMGSPLAMSQSVTLGIVSNVKMVMPQAFAMARFTLDGEDVGSLVRWIGHDADIYPGNSGGPLVDLKGQVPLIDPLPAPNRMPFIVFGGRLKLLKLGRL